jgi:hypothetical protein
LIYTGLWDDFNHIFSGIAHPLPAEEINVPGASFCFRSTAMISSSVYFLAFVSPPGGSIRIRIDACDLGGTVEVHVTDTGEGIPEQDLPGIFERSYRLNSATNRTRGTGLGLSIARGIIEAHGGLIRATSRPGDGSVFTFTLPRQ